MSSQAQAWKNRAWRVMVVILVATTVTMVTPAARAQDGGAGGCGDVTVTAAQGAAGLDAAILATNACAGPQTIFVETGTYQKGQSFETISDDVTILGDVSAPPTFIITFLQAGQYTTTFTVRDGAVANFEHLIFVDTGSTATFIDVKNSTVNVSGVVMNGSVPSQSESGAAGIWAEGSTLSVTDTQILNPDSFGILGHAGTHLTAVNLVIDGAAFSGIDVDSIDATNIRVSNSASSGLRLHDGGTIRDSFFWNNGGTGISHTARPPEVLIENTMIGVDPDANPGPNLHGISGFGQFTLTNVVVANSTQHGVQLSGNGGNPATLTDVEITNNGASGFNGTSVGFDFLRVSITNNGGNGFYTQWVVTTAVDTTITGNDVDCGFFNSSITDNGGNVDSDGTCGFVIPNDPPTPADDSADATLGQTITIDVLANDTDPDGDDLIITSASSSNATVAADGLSLTYVAPGDFSGETFTYEVADDQDERASASVTVDLVCLDITVAAAAGGLGFTNAVLATEACPGAQTILVEPGNYILDTGFRILDELAIGATNPADRPRLVLRVPPTGTGYLFYVDAAAGPFALHDVDVEATAPWALAFIRSVNAAFESVKISPIGPPLGCSVGVPSTLFFDAATSMLTNVDLIQSSCNGIDAAASSDLTLASSRIVDAANHGVSTQGALRVVNSTISGSAGSGITNTGGQAMITISDSFLYSNGQDGIFTAGGSLTVTNSAFGTHGSGGELIVAGNTGAGVQATFTTVDLSGVVMANNDTGLRVANNGANTTKVEDSVFFDNTTTGLHVGNLSTATLATTELRTNGANCLLDISGMIVDGGGNSDDDGTCGTNHPPVAGLDRAAIQEDTELVLDAPGALINDGDIDGDVITAELVSGPSHAASFDLRPDGGVAYKPQANFFGDDQFTYRVTDGSVLSEPTQFNIRVLGVNDAPQIHGPTEQLVERNTLTPLAISVSDVDADDAPPFFPADDVVIVVGLTVDLGKLAVAATTGVTITETSNGLIALEGELAAVNAALATVTYFPMTDFLGTATVTIVAEDRGENGTGGNLSDLAEIAIDVRDPNRPPTTQDEDYTIDEDSTLSVSAPGVLGNDIEPDGDEMTASLITGPASGTLILDSDGSFTFTPPADFFGEVFFIYQALDGQVGSNDARVTITIDPINDDPVVTLSPPSLAFDEDGEGTIVVTVTDADNAVGEITVSAGLLDSTLGTVAITGTGPSRDVKVTGALNAFGDTTVQIGVNDGVNPAAYFVPLMINAVDDPPAGQPDTYDIDEGNTLVVDAPGVLINDADIDTPASDLTAQVSTPPAQGSLSLAPDGSFTYTPSADFFGDANFAYIVSDATTTSDPIDVTVRVAPINDAPTIDAPVSVETEEATPVTFTVTIDDVETDLDGLELTAVTDDPTTGSVSLGAIDAAGQALVTFTPTAGPRQSVITVRVTESADNTSTATANITIDVRRANTAPTAILRTIDPIFERPHDISLSATSSSDPENDPLTFAWSDNVEAGSNSSTARFKGPLDDGGHTVTVQVCDNFGACDTASQSFTILNVRPQVRVAIIPPVLQASGKTGVLARVTVSDEGALDTHIGSIDWGDGSVDDFIPTLGDQIQLANLYETPPESQDFTITITVTDDDGGVWSQQWPIVIEPAPNEPPTARLGPTTSLRSGRSATLSAAQSTDDRGIVEYRWSVSGLSGEIITTVPTVSLELPVQSTQFRSRTFTLTVVDTDGIDDTTTEVLTVQHGGAIFTLRDLTLEEGAVGRIMVDYEQPALPGTGGQLRFFPTQGGCHRGSDAEWVSSPGQLVFNVGLPSASFPFLPPMRACADAEVESLETLEVELRSGGEVARATLTIEDAPPNMGPTAEFVQSVFTVTEGSGDVLLDARASTDPEGDSLTYAWSSGITNLANGIGALNTDDSGQTIVSVQVCDQEPLCDTATATVRVVNARPVVELTGPPIVLAGAAASFTLDIDDAGILDTHRAEFNWGDLAGQNEPDVASGDGFEHVYASPGQYEISVLVTDDDGGSDTATFSVLVVEDTFAINTMLDRFDADLADGVCWTGEFLAGGAPECSLRAAIEQSNVIPGAQTLNIPSGTYSQTEALDVAVTDDVALEGSSLSGVVLRISLITNGTAQLSIADLTMTQMRIEMRDQSTGSITDAALTNAGVVELYEQSTMLISTSTLHEVSQVRTNDNSNKFVPTTIP